MSVSTRYAAATALLLGLALLPTTLHNYIGLRVDDGKSIDAAAPPVVAGMPGSPTGRDAEWGRRAIAAHQFVERSYQPVGAPPVILSVARSYDAKQLYHHPELVVAYGMNLTDHEVVRLESLPEVPIHLLTGTEGGQSYSVMYALAYDGAFVADPVRFQLGLSGKLLFSGRKAMTLIFTRSNGRLPRPVDASAQAEVLVAAIRGFRGLAAPAASHAGGRSRHASG
jgi:hypothetical protein